VQVARPHASGDFFGELFPAALFRYAAESAHVRNFHNATAAYLFKALRRKRKNFELGVCIHVADILKTYLTYLPELPAGAVGAVNAFAVVNLAGFAKPLAVFYYGKGYVRLKRKKSAVAAAESYYIFAAQEVKVAGVKRIFFESPHLKARIRVTFKQPLKT